MPYRFTDTNDEKKDYTVDLLPEPQSPASSSQNNLGRPV